MSAEWQALHEELRWWQGAGRQPVLWLRDDDAVAPSLPLDRLIALCDRHQIPAVLAVIPEPSGEDLARYLKEIGLVRVVVHGWRHANHAPPGEKKQELGAHRPIATMIDELERGLCKLGALHGPKLLAMLVPPWNRMDPQLIPQLPMIGFRLVSSIADNFLEQSSDQVRVVNVHLDVMDSKSGRCRDQSALLLSLVKELQRARQTAHHPIGVLTHHRVHDEAAWAFLGRLFEVTADQGLCRWVDGDALIDAVAGS